mgnify:CR=1 FL=1
MLPLRPDMAGLSVGSNKFPTRVYENPPDLVDWLAAEIIQHDVKPEIEGFAQIAGNTLRPPIQKN